MRRAGGAGAVAAMALTCVFGSSLLLAMAAGAGVYRHVGERIAQSSQERVGLTYITAKIHSADQAGAVSAAPFGGVDAVRLTEEVDGVPYETILYVYDGALRELYCEQAWEPGPDAGQAIAEAAELRASEAAPGLLRLSYTGADGRSSTAEVWLRSALSVQTADGGGREGGVET